MKVALIGANGQLGSDLAKSLPVQGHDVVALTHADVEVTDAASIEAMMHSKFKNSAKLYVSGLKMASERFTFNFGFFTFRLKKRISCQKNIESTKEIIKAPRAKSPGKIFEKESPNKSRKKIDKKKNSFFKKLANLNKGNLSHFIA